MERWLIETVQVSNGFVHAADDLRVPGGIPNRLDRLATLGNSVVQQVVEMIGRGILAAEAKKLLT